MVEKKQQISEIIYKNYSFDANLLIRDTNGGPCARRRQGRLVIYILSLTICCN